MSLRTACGHTPHARRAGKQASDRFLSVRTPTNQPSRLAGCSWLAMDHGRSERRSLLRSFHTYLPRVVYIALRCLSLISAHCTVCVYR